MAAPKTCLLRIKLPSGETFDSEFEEDDFLEVVQVAVLSKSGLENVLLSTPIPRRVFTEEEMSQITLKQAGLTPKANLIVQLRIATDMVQDKTPVVTPGVKHVHTSAEYAKLKATPNKLVVVDFSAEWCGPCKAIAPVYEQLSKKYKDVVFIHLDVEELKDEADCKDVSGIPTFKFFKSGKLLQQFSGADPNKLEKAIIDLSK